MIDTATSTVADISHNIPGGALFGSLSGVAVTPDGSKVYVPTLGLGQWEVAVIDTATDTVTAGIQIGNESGTFGVGWLAVAPGGSEAYVVTTNNDGTSTVSVIDTVTNTVVGMLIPVGSSASGIAVTPDGSKVYVGGKTVSVIDPATNTVVAVLPVGGNAFGVFIQPRFAGTIGDASAGPDVWQP